MFLIDKLPKDTVETTDEPLGMILSLSLSDRGHGWPITSDVTHSADDQKLNVHHMC
jgi:hypothetical protein